MDFFIIVPLFFRFSILIVLCAILCTEISWITDGDVSYLNSFVGDSLELLSCTSYSFLRSRIYVQVSFCTYFLSVWYFFCPIIATSGLVSNSFRFFCLYDINHWIMMIWNIFLQVFSAFGFVHKIATFEKAAGFQVWCWLQ